MEKSLNTLSHDPWNKLKVYVALRLIEQEKSEEDRARLLLHLARERKGVDPQMTLDLCEAALRTCPKSPRIGNQVEQLIADWVPRPSSAAAAKPQKGKEKAGVLRTVLRPKKKKEAFPDTVESSDERSPVPAKAKQAAPQRSALAELQAQRKEMVAKTKASLKSHGIDGFTQELLASKGITKAVSSEIEGFQPNWIGMVQFVDYLQSKGALSVTQFVDIIEELEQVLLLVDPKNSALERLKQMRARDSSKAANHGQGNSSDR